MLVVAALLAGVVYLVGRPGPAPAVEVAMMDLDAPSIDRIELRWSADGSLGATVARSADGTWVMQWRAGAARGTWPVLGSRVMAAIRLLGDVGGFSQAQQEEMGEPVWITLRAGDRTVELAAAKRSFGGRGVVVRTAGDGGAANLAADVDGELVQVFQRPDVLAWRDMSVFPADMTGASRVEMITAAGASPGDAGTAMTRLARVGGRWAMSSPARARADVAQVEGMLTALKKLRVARFPDDQSGWTPPATSEPPRRIVIETDRRTPDAGPDGRWVLRQELVVRAGAGPEDDVAVAEATVSIVRPSGPAEILWGPTLIMIDAATLNEVMRPAESFASRLATPVVAADVRMVEVAGGGEGFKATRRIDRWDDADGNELSLAQRDAVRTIIELLTSEPAVHVELAPVEPPPTDAVTIRLGGADGPPLAEVRCWIRPGQAGLKSLLIHSEGVTRVYSPDATARWLEATQRLGAVNANDPADDAGSTR